MNTVEVWIIYIELSRYIEILIYIEDHRQAWQCCAVLNIASIFVVASTINPYTSISINLQLYFVSTYIQNGVIIHTAMSFVFLIRTLHTRFAALNRFFRYFRPYRKDTIKGFFVHKCHFQMSILQRKCGESQVIWRP